jgi:hypothetical protein
VQLKEWILVCISAGAEIQTETILFQSGWNSVGGRAADHPQTIRRSSADGLRFMCRWSPLTSFIGTTAGDLQVGPLLKFWRIRPWTGSWLTNFQAGDTLELWRC